MKAIVLTEEGKIYQSEISTNLHQIIRKYISRNYQLRHPSTSLPFSIVLICSPTRTTKRVNPIIPILFPDIKISIKGDVIMCKEGTDEKNAYAFLAFTDEEIETIRLYFLKSLAKMKDEIEQERQIGKSIRLNSSHAR